MNMGNALALHCQVTYKAFKYEAKLDCTKLIGVRVYRVMPHGELGSTDTSAFVCHQTSISQQETSLEEEIGCAQGDRYGGGGGVIHSHISTMH